MDRIGTEFLCSETLGDGWIHFSALTPAHLNTFGNVAFDEMREGRRDGWIEGRMARGMDGRTDRRMTRSIVVSW